MTPTPQIADYATPTPFSIGRDASLAQAHRLMRANHIRHLPVLDAKKLVGLVSQRDLLLMETIDGVDPENVLVEEAMTSAPYVVERDTPLHVAAMHMWKNKLGSAVVVDHQHVVGVFTTSDALQALVEVLARKPARRVQPVKAGLATRRVAR